MEDTFEVGAVAMNAEGTAPDWIELIPAGPIVRGRDRREWMNVAPQRIVDAFHASGRPIVIDWEHGSELNAARGERAPAAGWIEDMELRGGAVWGRARWTPKGGEDVAQRGYRYVSPTLLFDGTTREILQLKSVGLTHNPNLELKAMNKMEESTDTDMAKIARALSLDPAKASIASVLSAIEKLRNGEGVPAMNAALDTDAYVPRRDYELAVAQLQEYREREYERHEVEIEEAVNSVIGVGDPAFPPAKREEYLAMCRERGGLERFREIMVPDPSRSLSRSLMDNATPPRARRTLGGDAGEILGNLGLTADALDD